MLLEIIAVLAVTSTSASTPNTPLPHTVSDNPEMTRIYDADQADRHTVTIDWNIVRPADAKRREQTKALIAADGLHTGQDFERAAFVYQHGEAPDDFLLAHTLAMIALEKGRSNAVWIATATLDRYLQAIGQKQIYGTQFAMPYAKEAPTTQEPYNRALVSDPLRQALHVPPLSEQEKQRVEMEANRANLISHRVKLTVHAPLLPPNP